MILVAVLYNLEFCPRDCWFHSSFLSSSSPKPLLQWMTPIFGNRTFKNLINLLILTIKR